MTRRVRVSRKGKALVRSGSIPALRHRTLVTTDNFEQTHRRLSDERRLIVDTETTGLEILRHDEICGISVGTPSLDSFYFPIRHAIGVNLPDSCRRALVRLLKQRQLTGWNTKFDLLGLLKEGLDLPDYAEDVMLAAHLADENARSFALKEQGKLVVKDADVEQKELMLALAERNLSKGDIAKLPPEIVMEYACQDVQLTEQLRSHYCPRLESSAIYDIWEEVNEYMLATARMEHRGMLVDEPLMRQYLKEARRKQNEAEKVLHRLAGYEINPRSPKQLQKWLKLDSTRLEILEEIGSDREDVQALLTYRSWNRVSSAYYEAYLERLHETDDGMVLHPNIKLHGTISGRPSASNPAMQAIPRTTDIYRVKDVFIARHGYVLASLDYSQAELRLGAHYAKDERMKKLLRDRSIDFHQQIAESLHIPRDSAKRINFGVWYGLGAPGLAQRLKIPESKARTFLELYHERHPNIRKLYTWLRRQAETLGYIRLWTGRMRHFDDPFQQEPHKAMSNLIQGGVAEMMRHAIMGISTELQQEAPILLQVHDQLLLEVRDDRNRNRTIARAVQLMESAGKEFDVPMFVDVSVGPRWGTLTPWGGGKLHENQWIAKSPAARVGRRGRSVRKRR